MDRQELIGECLRLPDTYEDYPFHDPNWTVIRCRKNKKVFAWIFEREGNIWINLKTDPQWRDFWRDTYASIVPAYHLNKEHWNSLIMDGTIPMDTVRRMIQESYDLVKGKK
ncbi:MAG: MmcQ/YjbR family DNA-binding protein [Blautia sp.]